MSVSRMMRSGAPSALPLAICLLLVQLTPSRAIAQMGMGGRRGESNANTSTARNVLDPHMATLLRSQTNNPEDPTAFILAGRQDLKLADSQVTAIYTVRTRMLTRQAGAKAVLDTLGPNQPLSASDLMHMTPTSRDSIIAHRKAVAAANNQVHDAAVAARQEIVSMMTAEQQKSLIDLEQRVREERSLPHDSAEGEEGFKSHGSARRR